jgi:hypothetical protein
MSISDCQPESHMDVAKLGIFLFPDHYYNQTKVGTCFFTLLQMLSFSLFIEREILSSFPFLIELFLGPWEPEGVRGRNISIFSREIQIVS